MNTSKTKRMALISASMLTAVLAAGCTKDPEKVEQTTNPKVAVETLFTHDGCTVYRFDDGRDHYFARCDNRTEVVATRTESCGKNCTRNVDENIGTEYR